MSTVQTVQATLDNVRLFLVDVTLFSAFRKAKTEDIKAAKGVEVHADEVLTLGSQRVFDTTKLNVFTRLKDRMHRTCQKYGTPFLSGYAVPDSRAETVADELDKIVAEAMGEKATLLVNYEDWLDKFCQDHVEWEPQIRAKAFSRAYIDNRVGFKYQVIRVAAARDDGALVDGLSDQVGGLLGNLLRDVAQMAEDLQVDSLTGREKVTRKALRPLKAARDKMLGFTFLDPRVQAVADMIDAVCNALPGDGPIEGADLAMLWGITGMLADPGKMMKVAESWQPDNTGSFLDSLRPAPQIEVSMQPEQVQQAPAAATAAAIVAPAAFAAGAFALDAQLLSPAAPAADPFAGLAMQGFPAFAPEVMQPDLAALFGAGL